MEEFNETLPFQNAIDYDHPTTKWIIIVVIYCFVLIFGLFAIFLNTTAILAISRIRGLIHSNIRLVCCLATFDLLIAFVVVCEAVMSIIYYTQSKDHNEININHSTKTNSSVIFGYNNCFALILHILHYIGYNGTLLSMVAVATDLYVAIMHPLRYSRLVRPHRVTIAIGILITISLLTGSSELYLPSFNSLSTESNTDISYISTQYFKLLSSSSSSPPLSPHYSQQQQQQQHNDNNFCSTLWKRDSKSSIATLFIVLISIIIVSIVYIRVFYEIRRFQQPKLISFAHHKTSCINQTNYLYTSTNNNTTTITTTKKNKNQQKLKHNSHNNNMRRNQRGLATTLILLFVFLLCFLPSFIVELYALAMLSMNIKLPNTYIRLTRLLLELPVICTVLDPILYSFRLKDIKKSSVKLWNICCFCYSNKPIQKKPPIIAGRPRTQPPIAVFQSTHHQPTQQTQSTRKTLYRRSLAGTSPQEPCRWDIPSPSMTSIFQEKIRHNLMPPKQQNGTVILTSKYVTCESEYPYVTTLDPNTQKLGHTIEEVVPFIMKTSEDQTPRKSLSSTSPPIPKPTGWSPLSYFTKSLRDSWSYRRKLFTRANAIPTTNQITQKQPILTTTNQNYPFHPITNNHNYYYTSHHRCSLNLKMMMTMMTNNNNNNNINNNNTLSYSSTSYSNSLESSQTNSTRLSGNNNNNNNINKNNSSISNTSQDNLTCSLNSSKFTRCHSIDNSYFNQSSDFELVPIKHFNQQFTSHLLFDQINE